MNHAANTISSMNQRHGICGFAASIYMASQLDPGRMPTVTAGNLAHRTLVEIAYFLQVLERQDRNLFSEIEKFTRTFGKKHKKFDIKKFMWECNKSVEVSQYHIMHTLKYDIAMPPEAVAAYLRHAWGINTRVQRLENSNGGEGDGIFGLCSKGGIVSTLQRVVLGTNNYGNLQHWVYRYRGVVYSWGNAYGDLRSVNPNWKVGWKIS